MKLWIKLSLVAVLVMLVGMAVSGVAVLYHEKQYNQEKTLESYEQQLKFTAYSLGKELESGLRAGYNQVTMNSYVDFVMKRFEGYQYILIKDNQVISNRTPYELVNPEDERWAGKEPGSVIFKRENQYFLIMGQRISVGGVVDISLSLFRISHGFMGI